MTTLSMKRLWAKVVCPFSILIVVPFTLVSCGLFYHVDGVVVDADSGKPVEGAVVSIHWQRNTFWGPLSPNGSIEEYGNFEAFTDQNGVFRAPKFLIGHHYMGVYKPGYICWGSESYFDPQGKEWDEIFKKRYGHRVSNGMTISLVPKKDPFPKEKHAIHVDHVASLLHWPTPMFDLVTKKEDEILDEYYARRRKERGNKQ